MKTHLVNKKQNPLQLVVLVIVLVLSSLIGKAQSDGSGSMRLDITDDRCNQGIGSAHLTVSSLFQSQMMITWGYEDFITGESREVYDVLSLNNLHQGRVGVIVRSCDKIIFESYKYVGNDSNEFYATITVTTNTQSCDDVSAELVVVPSGGMGPYTFEWGTNFKTVYEPGYYSCKVWDSYNNECIAATYVTMEKLKCAVDPNEIIGPDGFGEDMMVSASAKMPYSITFENDPEFATAPASRVEIDYPIPAEQKIASFRLGDFGFGQFVFTVPSNTSTYYQRLDVSDSLGVWVDVTAGIDVVHGKAFWVFQSIDPSTGSEPQSSQLGFLLVNDELGRGEGYVSYNILPTDGLNTGDTTAAIATIVFDDNAPISTNVWSNKFDAVAPTSTIANLNFDNDSTNCLISFSSQDDLNGSGVQSIELFVSLNGEQYVSVGSYAPETEVNYSLMGGSLYEFISIATDNVGNVEEFKTVPDAFIDFGSAPTDITLSKYYFYENELVGSIVGELNTIDLGDVFTYQLVDGDGAADNDLFAISGNRLVTNVDFNCEERLSYSIRVRSTDVSNLFFEKEFEIGMVKTNQTYNLNYEGEACQGESFFGYGWNIDLLDSVSGTYTYVRNLETTRGCDSIRTLTLTVHPAYSTLIEDEILEGEDYNLNGFNIVNPPVGVLYDSLLLNSIHGCDSVVMLELTVNPLAVTQTNTLVSGWNWWSTFIEMSTESDFDKLKIALGSNASMIKSRNNGFVSYIGGWYGSLTSINNQNMYMIKMNSEETIEVTGALTDVNENIITINNGWNWIGYPSKASSDLNSALVNLTPHESDIIKTRTAFATYLPALGGWYGSLSQLTPGLGYMYRSNATEPVEFVYNTPSRGTQGTNEFKMVNQWEMSVGEYAENATMIGVIAFDGEEQHSESLVLGAFVGNHCVGQSKVVHVEPIDRYVLFLTYFGDEKDLVTFRLYDEDSGIEYSNSTTQIEYVPDAVVGTLYDPFVIDFSFANVDEYYAGNVMLSPNPVWSGDKVRINLNNGSGSKMKVEIINELGVVVYSNSYHTVSAEINATFTPGIYIVKVSSAEGVVNYGKLVVE